MGVLNFSVPVRRTLQNPGAVRLDLLAFVHDRVLERETATPTPVCSSRSKRKRTKSGSSNSSCSYYDFRDYGIDERRKGARHRRRRQNLIDIGVEEDDDVFEDGQFFDNRNTVFSELFKSEEKMKKWEDFVDLSDEEQSLYVEGAKTDQVPCTTADNAKPLNDKLDRDKYLLIDKKLRDMLRSNNKPVANDLLKYYEDLMADVLSPAIILLSVESAYDRMLVYAVCQYMALTSTTIKMKSSTFIEVILEGDWVPPSGTLTKYLKNRR